MGYLQQNVIVHGFFTVEHIGEVFHHSVEFVGQAGKSVSSSRSEGATGLKKTKQQKTTTHTHNKKEKIIERFWGGGGGVSLLCFFFPS